MFALLPALPGCTTYHPVDLPVERLRQELALGNLTRPGDTVKVRLANGQSMQVSVVGHTESGLITSSGEIAFEDIIGMEARVPDDVKTTTAILGVSTLVSLLLLSAALSSLAFVY